MMSFHVASVNSEPISSKLFHAVAAFNIDSIAHIPQMVLEVGD